MIKYEGIEKKYFYNSQDLEDILNIIENGNFYNESSCTQENVSALIDVINSFFNNINSEEQKVILERHETEEEAREYFGDEFIEKFDKLLTVLDKQKTIVALHGTSVEVCPKICDTGLQYKSPSLSSTAVQQSMAYGQREMHYQKYESLLNWGHKNYKGLVIVAVPYECFYKEGLWNHFQKTDTSIYGGQDYRIDPDFIVGYLDINGKNIVINPKYNRQHNYDGYENDIELFREQKGMDNGTLTQLLIESEKALEPANKKIGNNSETEIKEDIDTSRVPYVIDNFIGTFKSLKNGSSNCMNESRYKSLLEELSYGFSYIQKVLPLLKTNEQLREETEAKYSMFSQPTTDTVSDEFSDDWGDNIQWEDEIQWENSVEKTSSIL